MINGYFQETVLESKSQLTANPSPIFDRLGHDHTLFLDDEGHIEHEWGEVVGREWFEAWYADILRDGKAQLIQVSTYPEIRKRLLTLGFPKTGGDIWYVRTAKTVSERCGNSYLITEDMDFFDPKRKRDQARKKILQSKAAPVAKYLRKKENVIVACVKAHIASLGRFKIRNENCKDRIQQG